MDERGLGMGVHREMGGDIDWGEETRLESPVQREINSCDMLKLHAETKLTFINSSCFHVHEEFSNGLHQDGSIGHQNLNSPWPQFRITCSKKDWSWHYLLYIFNSNSYN